MTTPAQTLEALQTYVAVTKRPPGPRGPRRDVVASAAGGVWGVTGWGRKDRDRLGAIIFAPPGVLIGGYMSQWLEWVKALQWPIGADCWYWATWATDGGVWQQAILLGADQKDGYPIFDVMLPDAGGVVVWGWVWQVGLGARPTERPPALDGATGPWP